MASLQKAKIINYRRETPQSVSIAFDVFHPFIPGQYINVEVELNGEKHRRAYSICSAPYENEIRIGVKKVENGTVSVYLTEQVNSGDELLISKPEGNFTHQPDSNNQHHYLLFAAGSGITPLMSIAKSVLHDEPKSKVTLFYGNSNTESVMFKEELDFLDSAHVNFKVIHILTDGSLKIPLLTGRITFEKAMQLMTEYANDSLSKEIFTCGPQQMMEAVKSAAEVLGYDRIHMEYFTPPEREKEENKAAEPENDFEGSSLVKVILDDEEFECEVPAKGKPILDYCIEKGIDPPYSCRGGICISCIAKVEKGKVVMENNNSLTEKELAEGYILTCQAHPASEKVVINYDD